MKSPGCDDSRPAFERLTFEHMDGLYRVALQMTRNRADAEDLVQDTYLRAYRFFHTYRPGTNARAWMFTILRNLFINNYHRKRSRPEEVDLDGLEGCLSAPRDDSAEARLLFDSTAMRRGLDRLPERTRTMLVLAYVEGFSAREIAEVIRCPVGTVLSQVFRARKRLRDELERPPAPRPRRERIRSRLPRLADLPATS